MRALHEEGEPRRETSDHRKSKGMTHEGHKEQAEQECTRQEGAQDRPERLSKDLANTPVVPAVGVVPEVLTMMYVVNNSSCMNICHRNDSITHIHSRQYVYSREAHNQCRQRGRTGQELHHAVTRTTAHPHNGKKQARRRIEHQAPINTMKDSHSIKPSKSPPPPPQTFPADWHDELAPTSPSNTSPRVSMGSMVGTE